MHRIRRRLAAPLDRIGRMARRRRRRAFREIRNRFGAYLCMEQQGERVAVTS